MYGTCYRNVWKTGKFYEITVILKLLPVMNNDNKPPLLIKFSKRVNEELHSHWSGLMHMPSLYNTRMILKL